MWNLQNIMILCNNISYKTLVNAKLIEINANLTMMMMVWSFTSFSTLFNHFKMMEGWYERLSAIKCFSNIFWHWAEFCLQQDSNLKPQDPKMEALTTCPPRCSVAQLDAPSDWRPGGWGFNPRQGWQHSFVEIDHEIYSTIILSLLLIQEGQLSVSGERMYTILVNCLED